MTEKRNIRFCRRCLYSSAHPLGIVIDGDGICSGCRIHEEKDKLDWKERFTRLEKLVEPYRSRNNGNYDCIVPVSGGGDSYFIVHIVKNVLKMNPLLTSYNKYFNTPTGIRNLANLRIKFNCDILIQNVNPISVKKIVKRTLGHFGSIYWHCLAGQTVFPVQTSVRYKIPLIIWGAHQGLEQVGMFSHEHEVEMTRRYRKDHDLMGYEADDLLDVFGNLTEADIWQYRYPDDQALNAIGTRGIYLGNFLRWDPKAQHEEMIRLFDYKSYRFARTFDTYDHVDCFNYMEFHDNLKLNKHGYSKVTDHASREIRHGRLDRKTGLELVRKHEQQPPENLGLLMQWLDIKEQSLLFLADEARNRTFWEDNTYRKFTFAGLSQFQQENSGNTVPIIPEFIANSSPDNAAKRSYVIIGKGYP